MAMYNDNFAYDFAFGQEGERIVAAIFNDIMQGSDKVEVKRDRLVSRTGNVAVEIATDDRPSGLSISQVDWYTFLLSGDQYSDDVMVAIKTERLRRLVARYQAEPGHTKRGGDGGRFLMVLVPVQELLLPNI